jgi:EAL domain-containing protein (putative c-di-GMP-specific phosphodiesterase class I)
MSSIPACVAAVSGSALWLDNPFSQRRFVLCSLQYLQRFPFDKIKIDRSFVKEVTRNTSSASIIRAVVSIAADRDMITTAEGVQTKQQRDTVQMLGCTQMQGYLFSRPLPASELRAMLAAEGTATEDAATAARAEVA